MLKNNIFYENSFKLNYLKKKLENQNLPMH